MNKKISTLLAGALLVGSASAYAVNANKVAKLEKGYYVLNAGAAMTAPTATPVGSHFQVVNGKLTVADGLGFTAGQYNQGLWTIAASAANSNHFSFKNKADGLSIAFDPKTAVKANASGVVAVPTTGSELTGASMAWAWVANSDDATTLGQAVSLTYAFTTDSTMALAKAGDGTVYAYKYANAKKGSVNVAPLTFQAIKPTSVVMTATDLNVLKDATNAPYFTLTPNKKDLKVDAITGVKFFAEDVVAATGFVTLKEQGTEKYLRVDTAVHAASGLNENNLYQLARKALKVSEMLSVPNYFKIEKDLYKDSVFVSIAQDASRFTYSETPNDEGSNWYEALDEGTPYPYCTLSSILLTPTTEVMTFFSPEAPSTTTWVKENLLFAVSDAAQVADSKASVDDGLYYIMNKKGQYLASPIYNNGDYAEWITINKDEQNVAHMPAFQWVVLKNNPYEYAAPKSPVSITNREFAEDVTAVVQLNKTEGGKYYYSDDIDGGDSLDFVLIEDKAILGDTLLGYKNFEAGDLIVNRYQFNYFNPYVSDKYIGKSTDSLLVVKDGVLPFVVKQSGAITDYGYPVADANGRIEGLKQLRRQAYTMSAPSVKGELKFGVSAEDKYALSTTIDATVFYFKENNDVKRANDEKKNDFYSLVVKDFEYKAGVADETQDATLKQQLIGEVRTSSFLIAPYDAPLYRRFNNAKLEGNAGDAADTLRFKEKYRGEYLQVEVNPNFTVKGIDFLGAYTPDFTKDGKSFIVDTAFVNRFSGKIKPQYLISIDRDDHLGKEGVPCTYEHNHFDNQGNPVDNAHCSHAVAPKAGFHMGKYLVNFADSVATAVKATDYNRKGYTRAGFVKAVHMGDSLYILTGKYADVTKATFDAAAIIKDVKDGKYAAKYIVNLQGDAHKLVTWSMRFLNPEKAANELEADRAFLMESIKAEDDPNDIAPVEAQWLKMQNGCLVLSGTAGAASTFDQVTGDDDALIFNIEKGSKQDLATENEAIAAATFGVIAKQGAVEIIGATGKTVVISNILGQVIANTVLTSDDAVIAAPAGVVVVAVEGEDAVKAIVK